MTHRYFATTPAGVIRLAPLIEMGVAASKAQGVLALSLKAKATNDPAQTETAFQCALTPEQANSLLAYLSAALEELQQHDRLQ